MDSKSPRKIGPGLKNPKYIIYAGRRMAGLFSHVIEFLKMMSVVDKLKDKPIVVPYWINDTPYWSASGHHGKKNVFEYYFEPINNFTIDDALPVVPTAQEISEINIRYPGYRNRNKQILLRYEVNGFPEDVCIVACNKNHIDGKPSNLDLHKYIKVRPFILKKVKEFRTKFMDGQHVIGVHIRGPNQYELRNPLRNLKYNYKRNGSLDNVPFKEYFALVDYHLREHPNSRILVATDDSQVLEKFKERYKERVIHYNAKRAVGGETHLINKDNPLLKNESKAILGEEVLIEVLLLSKSDYFIYGPSNISHAIILWSPQLECVNVFRPEKWPAELRPASELSIPLKVSKPRIMITSGVRVCRVGHQQIHRDTAFMLAELFNLEYVHSPIDINGKLGKEVSPLLDDFFGIAAGAPKISEVDEANLCKVELGGHRFGKQYNSELEGLDFDYIKGEIEKCNAPGMAYLLVVSNGLFFSLGDLKKYVDGPTPKLFGQEDYARVSASLKRKFFDANKSREPYFKKGVFNIAVHIRKGDIANPNHKGYVKYLPDKYYIETINRIVSTVKGRVNYGVHIYTGPNAPLEQDLENRPDIEVHRSKGPEGIIEDLYHLATADVLVHSKSFFSMVASERSNGFQVFWDNSWNEESLSKCLPEKLCKDFALAKERLLKESALAKERLLKESALAKEREKELEKRVPLLMSFPCSGAHWIRYCVEYFSGKRTPGKELWAIGGRLKWAKYLARHGKILMCNLGLANPNDFIMGRSHHPKVLESRHNKLILLLRNYKELFVRTSFPLSNSKMGVFENLPKMIQSFHEFNGDKLLVYYEDLVSEDFTCMGEVLSFLGIDYDLGKCDLSELKRKSVKMKGSKSFKDGAPQMIYYSLKLQPAERAEIDNKFREKLGDLYETYLGRYAEGNLKY